MGMLLMGVSLIVGLTSLVCWILVLVKMFTTNILLGICGICPLVALIWGFMKMNEKGLQKVMTIWSVCILISLVMRFAARGMVAAGG